MFVLLLAVPPRRRLQFIAVGLLLLFVGSLFVVDLDVNEDDEDAFMPGDYDDSEPDLAVDAGKSHASSPFSTVFHNGAGVLETPYDFKIFVYEDVPNELYRKLRRNAQCKNEYTGSEKYLPSVIKRLDVYTEYGNLADFYLVPVMTECFLNQYLLAGKDFNRAIKELNVLFEATLDGIQSSYPFWSRTEGRDHVFLFPSERSASLLNEANLQRIRKAVLLTGMNSYKPLIFEPWKDIVIPTWIEEGAYNGTEAPPRDTFIYYRGTVPGTEDEHPNGLTYEVQKAIVDSNIDWKVKFEDLDDECSARRW